MDSPVRGCCQWGDPLKKVSSPRARPASGPSSRPDTRRITSTRPSARSSRPVKSSTSWAGRRRRSSKSTACKRGLSAICRLMSSSRLRSRQPRRAGTIFDHLIFTGRESLLSFSRCERVSCSNMLFRRRLLRQLISPRDRKYITSVVKRGDSWAGVAIYPAAKKAISYQAAWPSPWSRPGVGPTPRPLTRRRWPRRRTCRRIRGRPSGPGSRPGWRESGKRSEARPGDRHRRSVPSPGSAPRCLRWAKPRLSCSVTTPAFIGQPVLRLEREALGISFLPSHFYPSQKSRFSTVSGYSDY